MVKALRILIVSPETTDRHQLEREVWEQGLVPTCCDTVAAATDVLEQMKIDAVLCTDYLADGDYRAVLQVAGGVPVVVISHRADWAPYLSALAAGAFDYLLLPPAASELRRMLFAALRKPTGRTHSLARAA